MFFTNYELSIFSILTSRFVADKEFGGADHSRARDGPVQFQKDLVEEDPFGLTQVKKK